MELFVLLLLLLMFDDDAPVVDMHSAIYMKYHHIKHHAAHLRTNAFNANMQTNIRYFINYWIFSISRCIIFVNIIIGLLTTHFHVS